MAASALRIGQALIKRQTMPRNKMCLNDAAVGNRLAIIDDEGSLPFGTRYGIDTVMV